MTRAFNNERLEPVRATRSSRPMAMLSAGDGRSFTHRRTEAAAPRRRAAAMRRALATGQVIARSAMLSVWRQRLRRGDLRYNREVQNPRLIWAIPIQPQPYALTEANIR